MFQLAKTGKFGLNFLVTMSLVFVASFAMAETDVTATVDRNALNPDDTFTFSVSVNSADEVTIGQPTLPSLGDFEVLNQWTSQEARASFVTTPSGPQFKTVRSTRYNYMLQPKRQGSLAIGAVEVIVDGKTYNTKPINVRVAPGAGMQARPRGGQPPSGSQLPPGFNEDDEDDLFNQLLRRGGPPPAVGSRTLPINPNEAFFIQVDTDKTEAFVGEQITASWYLYTRGQIRDLDTLKYPSLKGFWKEEIEIATHLNFTQEVVNGVPYKKALLASFALFPIKEGTALIDPYTAKCSVITSDDPFGGFGKAFTFTKSSQNLKILVKPLPAEGRPADFSGAVGDFQVTSRVEDNNILANQPFTYKIRFEGKGNAKLIDIPPFQAPEGMELYDTQKEAKFFPTGTSYKDFSILLISRKEGDFTIPPVTVSIFDPQLKKYVQKTTEAVRVHVAPGQAGATIQGQNLSLDETNEKVKPKDDTPQLQTEIRHSLVLSPAQQDGMAVVLYVFVGATLLWRARRELGWGEKKKDLTRRLRARLKRVDTKIEAGDWRGVGVEMTNTVYHILGEISGEGGANVELQKLLLKAPPSIRRELSEPLTRQMEFFQILSFAPEGVVGDLKNPERLKAVVQDMSKLMEKAVSLGASSGPDDGSESGPGAS